MLDEVANAASSSVTTTTEQGIGQRLLNSVIGVLIGIVLFLGSFILLWWNEGNVIAEKNALNEVSHALVKGSADKPDHKIDNKLLYAVAKLDLDGKLGDAPYLKPGPYVALDRHAEMYQWVEKTERRTSKPLGGSQRYGDDLSIPRRGRRAIQTPATSTTRTGMPTYRRRSSPSCSRRRRRISASSTVARSSSTSARARICP